MYIEMLLVAVIIVFVMIYTNRVDTSKVFSEDNKLLLLLKEKDYEFLLRAKYGDNVINANQVFIKRIRDGIISIGLVLFIFLTDLKPLYVVLAFVLGFLVYKSQYLQLRKYYNKHLMQIDSLLPYYLKSLEILVQHYTVPVSLARSIDDAPAVFKPGLKELVAKIEAGDSTVQPYMDFALAYPVRDSMRMMRLLYRLSLGEQEKKHEQMLSFSKTVSSLQSKAREQKYKSRLDRMERKTMLMLVCTGGGTLVLLLISVFTLFVSV